MGTSPSTSSSAPSSSAPSSSMTSSDGNAPKSRNHKRLMNKAVHYLGRYQASQQSLRRVLKKFALRKLLKKDANSDKDRHDIASYEDSEDHVACAIEDVIADCVRYGYVNDQTLASAKARQSVISGQSAQQLSGKLRQMGVSQDIADQALAERAHDHKDAETAAAIRAMRKKRLGPYHKEAEEMPFANLSFEDQQKQFAKLARAGFQIDIIRTILALPNRDAAEDALMIAEDWPDRAE
ncbi:MAG: regulatory protein RecX [Candidatus Puniceispirillaceae bacterium]